MKLRSSQDFAATYSGNKKGIGIGIENFIHLKEESVAGTFVPPAIGSGGYSEGGVVGPSTDISAGPDDSIDISVDGSAVILATIASLVGLNTGDLIADALETAINNALSLAGLDARVYVTWNDEIAGGYYVGSQKTGVTTAVVITDTVGGGGNLADDLELGVANGGTENVGTDGGDFLFMTQASLKVDQPFEPSEHRTGRQASSIIRKKIMSEGDLEMYFNMDTGAGVPTVDTPVKLLLESVLGRMVDTGTELIFNSKDAQNKFFSAMQANNAFARAMNGVYTKSISINLPGDGEAKMTIPLKARDGRYASIAQVAAGATAQNNVQVTAGEEWNFDSNARVMIVDTDGRTVLYGGDGSLLVSSRDTVLNEVILNAPVTCSLGAYITHWAPHVFDSVGIDNPVTGLQGYVSFDNGVTQVEEIRSVDITFDPQIEDQDNYYGADGNRGFVVGAQSEIKITLDVMLSVSQMSTLMQTRAEQTFYMKVVLGDEAGRHVVFLAPKVKFAVPPVELPDSGSIALQLEGTCLQTFAGAHDAFEIRYR